MENIEYIQFILFAFLVEGMWENLKGIRVDGKFDMDVIGVLSIAIFFSCLTKLDLFVPCKLLSATTIPSQIGTGIILSRGGNLAHDFLKMLSNLMNGRKEE